MTNRTLDAIRRDAPDEDGGNPALIAPPFHTRKRGGYIPAVYKAQTLDQLSKWAGEYGEAAVTEARWCALSVWLMNGPTTGQLRNPTAVVSLSIVLCCEADRVSLGYPLVGGVVPPPRLGTLSPNSQDEARRTAQDTLEDWEQACFPHLTKSIERVQTFINNFGRDQRFPTERSEG